MVITINIVKELFEEIEKKFKKEAEKIFALIKSLEKNPNKGKLLVNVGGIIIKELKYKSFRFYFITSGHKLKLIGREETINLLIRFVRMSDKKNQQKTINEIKKVLQAMDPEEFI